MTKEELLQKDLTLLIASAALQNMAYLRTMIDTQAYIVSELSKRPKADIDKELDDLVKDNYEAIMKEVKNNIPDMSLTPFKN